MQAVVLGFVTVEETCKETQVVKQPFLDVQNSQSTHNPRNFQLFEPHDGQHPPSNPFGVSSILNPFPAV